VESGDRRMSGGEGGGGGKKFSERNELTPVNVKMAFEDAVQAGEGSFELAGRELSEVVLVCTLKGVEAKMTNIVYTVGDETSSEVVEVLKWSDADPSSGAAAVPPGMVEGAQVRVNGRLRTFQGKRSIMAHSVKLVENPAEAEYHAASIRFASAHAEEVAKRERAAPGGGPTGMRTAPSIVIAAPSNGMDACQSTVMNTFNERGTDDNGLHRNEVVHLLQGSFSAADVNNAIQFLVNEGHVYSTIDDDHFRSTAI